MEEGFWAFLFLRKAVSNLNPKEKQNISPVGGRMVTLGSKSETYFDTTFLKTSIFRRPIPPPLLQKCTVVWNTRLFRWFRTRSVISSVPN